MSLYEPLFRNVLFPAYESGLRRRRTLDYLREYEASQWLSPEEIAALQWARLKRLVEHCWAEVPYYRKHWQLAGLAGAEDIRGLDDYARLPVLTKQDIRDNFEQLIAPSFRGSLLYKTTGGSTGEPLRFGYTRESYERRLAVMWRGYGAAGVPLGGRALYLWGGGVGDISRASALKERLYHGAFNRRMLNCFDMREDNLSTFASAIESYKPQAIVAYVGAIVRLAQWMVENNRAIKGVKSILGAAESLHDFQRPVIEAAFPDATTYNTYGCREFMLIGSECEHHNGLHVNADHLLVEVLSPTTAGPIGGSPDAGACPVEAGDLVTTDLSNFGMPFIRYVGGDIAVPGDSGRCRCGRGLPRLLRVEGRKLDAIRTLRGHLLPGEFFPHMLKDVAGIQRFQVVQHRLDDFTISIVPGAGFDSAAEQYIRREIHNVIGDASTLRLRLVDDIPLTPSGKFRVTISELA
ncbi:phenylacetate--CoA ligase family protein [Lysobacter sp. A289]